MLSFLKSEPDCKIIPTRFYQMNHFVHEGGNYPLVIFDFGWFGEKLQQKHVTADVQTVNCCLFL